MGIDIYAAWRGQDEAEEKAQAEVWLTTTGGRRGYLREAYHGEPYATRFFCPEVFDAPGGVHIPAAVLKERLPHTLALVEERERKLYQSSPQEIEEVKQSFRDFVTLCEDKEKKTGECVRIVAWF